MGAFTGISWKGAAYQFFTDIVGSVTEPNYLIQEAGRKSADGERGAVWGVNVLSAYILVSRPQDLILFYLDRFLTSHYLAFVIRHKNSTPT